MRRGCLPRSVPSDDPLNHILELLWNVRGSEAPQLACERNLQTARKTLCVISLQPPAIAQWIKRGCFRSHEKSCLVDNFLQPKHFVFAQELEESSDSWNMDVIHNEYSVRFQMRIEIVVLQLRKRIAMRSVEKS